MIKSLRIVVNILFTAAVGFVEYILWIRHPNVFERTENVFIIAAVETLTFFLTLGVVELWKVTFKHE